ncbi:MAG: hypothetical protein H8E17_06550 [Deltaproteobacteria bacterium]|nr:hypothetical protein [Deltaproteobacteria bacterium]
MEPKQVDEKLKEYGEKLTERIAKDIYTPRDRVMKLLNFEEPDRLPGPTGLAMSFGAKHAGFSIKEICSDAKKFVLSQLMLMDLVGMEFPQAEYDVYNIEAEILGCKLLWTDTNFPVVAPGGEILKEKGDLSKLKIPDFRTEGRGPYCLEVNKLLLSIAPGILPFYFCISPFDIAFKIRGFKRLLKDIKKDPKFAHDLLEYCTEVAIEYTATLHDELTPLGGAEPFMWGASCDIPLVGEKIFKEYCLPYAAKVIKKNPYASWGIFRFVEVYGDKWPEFWEYYITETNSPIVFMYGMDTKIADLKVAKELTEKYKRYFIVGTDAETIRYANYEELDARIKRHIRDTAPGGGAAPVKLDTIPADTPVERVRYIVRKVKEYGTFPIDIEGLSTVEALHDQEWSASGTKRKRGLF